MSSVVIAGDTSGTVTLSAPAVSGTTTLTLPATTGTVLTNASQLVGTGTATNDSAAAGYVGEYVASTIAYGSAVTTGVAGTNTSITSISLTAGDWDVSGVFTFEGTGAISTLNWAMAGGASSLSLTSATQGVAIVTPMNNAVWTLVGIGFAIPTLRWSVSSTTTVYLVARVAGSGGGTIGWGQIRARRIR